MLQIVTGPSSEHWGRKGLILAGMWVQAAVIFVSVATRSFEWWLLSILLLGLGTAMVYPTLIPRSTITLTPAWRARSPSVYRVWRDLGYAVGALSARIIADQVGISWEIGSLEALTVLSGRVVAPFTRERAEDRLGNEKG